MPLLEDIFQPQEQPPHTLDTIQQNHRKPRKMDVFDALKKKYLTPSTLGLDRIRRLLSALGNPHHRLPPVIHLAGTNGKGSTAAYLHSILKAAGYKVHVYTSPHLHRLTERVVLQGQEISVQAFSELLAECETANGDAPLSWFEITTAAAFLAFSRTPGDVLILETGLGGRLDATNVIEHPAATILTPISYDHQDYLGKTLPKIAGEKAGIIKKNVPVISARQAPEVQTVFKKQAQAKNAPFFIEGQDWDICPQENQLTFTWKTGEKKTRALPLPPLSGIHQYQNLGVALGALHQLASLFKISEEDWAQGIQKTLWPGRLENLKKSPRLESLPPGSELWFDGGHNEGAAQAIANFTKNWNPKATLIWGMLASKDARKFISPFKDCVEEVLSIPLPEEHQSHDPKALGEFAQEIGISATPCESLDHAFKVLSKSPHPRKILVCGSLYLAGDL